MMKPVYFVSGSKGGVGKSVVSTALMDYLTLRDGELPALVDGDTDNPDVGWAYEGEKGIVYRNYDMDVNSGWIELLEMMEEVKEKKIVVNTPARNNKGVTLYGDILTGQFQEIQRDFIAFWVISQGRESLELLKEFIESVPDAKIVVVRNTFWGQAGKFDLYEKSNLRGLVESNGGKVMDFPVLAERVHKELTTRRWTIAKGAKDFTIGNRAELQRWRRAAAKSFDTVISE